MSDYKPITGELRCAWIGQDVDTWMFDKELFGNLCDAIDAIHAQLERENAELRERLAKMDNVGESMHGGITDELREWAHGFNGPWKRNEETLLAIADRIDAEHERQLEVLYRDMSDAEYVKLHKGADGEYINEHDKVDWRDHAGTWHENATVVALCNDGCYVMDGTIFHVHKSDIRHHYAPDTWERIIEDAEALAREWFNTDMSENEHADGLDALVARCKALAGDAK